MQKLLVYHYPIPEGLSVRGDETIKVCRTCYVEDRRRYPDWLIQRLINGIEGRRMPDFDIFGEEIYVERKKLIEELHAERIKLIEEAIKISGRRR